MSTNQIAERLGKFSFINQNIIPSCESTATIQVPRAAPRVSFVSLLVLVRAAKSNPNSAEPNEGLSVICTADLER
jgi:hypothetical protein